MQEVIAPNELTLKLKSLLEEEGLDTIEEVSERILSKQVELKELISKGKEKTNPAKKLAEEITRLNEIKTLSDQTKARIDSRGLEKLKAELKAKLEDEGLDDLSELVVTIGSETAKLEALKAKGKIESIPARTLTTRLASLKEIELLSEKIIAMELSQTRASNTTVNVSQSVAASNSSSVSKPVVSASSPSTNTVEARITESKRLEIAQVISETSDAVPKIGEVVSDVPLPEKLVPINIRFPSPAPNSVSSNSEVTHQPVVSGLPEAPVVVEITNELSDFTRNIPLCAEKSLAQLFEHFAKKVETLDKTKAPQKTLTDSQVTQIIQNLKIQLAAEKLDHPSICDSLIILDKEFAGSDCEKLKSEAYKMLKDIQPVDMTLMGMLIEKTAEATKQIQGQDIILLLGGTGAGKSTTIHFLAGSKMHEVMIQGIGHIEPIAPVPGLESFVTSPFARSETKSINAIKIEYANLETIEAKGIVFLCDTPGFGDTEGPEIDIANGIGLVNAVKGCRSVKPLILINQDGIGGRLEGIITISRTLVMLVMGIEDQLDKFSYIFTKFPKNQEKQIRPKLFNKLKNLNNDEKTIPGFVPLLQDMIKKTNPIANVIDPINDKPADLLDNLATTPAIKNPAVVFRDFVTPQSLDKLKEQIHRHQTSITTALSRFDVPLLNYKLGQLRDLNRHLHIQESQVVYDDCVKEITHFAQTLMEETFDRLDTCLLEGNTAVFDDLKAAGLAVSNLIKLEVIRIEHLTELTNLIDACATKIYRAQLCLLDFVKSQLNNPMDSNIASTIVHLNKMALIDGVFKNVFGGVRGNNCVDSIMSLYDKARSEINRYISKAQAQFILFYPQNHFAGCVNVFDAIKFFMEDFSSHIDTKLVSENYYNLIVTLEKYFQDRVDAVLGYYSKIEITSEEIAKLHEVINVLNFAQTVDGLKRHIAMEKVIAAQELLLEHSYIFCKKVSKEIERLCDAQHKGFFAEIKAIMSVLDALRATPTIDYKTTKIYHEIIDYLKCFVVNTKHQALLLLTIFSENKVDESSNYQAFKRYVAILKEAECFVEHPSGLYSRESNEVSKQFITYLSRINKDFQEVELSADKYEKLMSFYTLIQKILALSESREIIPQVGELCDQTKQYFVVKISDAFKAIEPVLLTDIRNVVLPDLRNAVAYLHYAKAINFPEISKPCAVLEATLSRFIEENFERIKKTLTFAFDSFASPLEDSSIDTAVAAMSACLSSLLRLREFYSPDDLFFKDVSLYEEIFYIQPSMFLSNWCLSEESILPRLAGKLLMEFKSSEKNDDVKTMYKKLNYVVTLQKLDIFITKGLRFEGVVISIKEAIRRLNDNLINQIKLYVATKKYQEAAGFIERMDRQNPEMLEALVEISKEITRTLVATVESLKEKVGELRLTAGGNELLKLIITDELSVVRNGVKHVLIYVDESVRAKLLQTVEDAEYAIHSKTKAFLEMCDAHIEKCEFHAVEQILESIKRIIGYFDGFETPSDQSYIQELVASVNKTREKIEKKLDAVMQKYDPLQLERFSEDRPVELLNHLRVASVDNLIYAQKEKDLTQAIQTTIASLLDHSKKSEKLEDIEAIVATIESIAMYLPPELYASFDASLKECKTYVNETRKKHEGELAECVAAGQIQKMFELLKQCAEKKSYSYMQKVKTEIVRFITDGASRLQADLDKGDLRIVLERLPTSWNIWKDYSTCLGDLLKPVDIHQQHLFEDVHTHEICQNTLAKIVATLNKCLQELDVGGSSSESIRDFTTHFDKLVSFLDLKNKVTGLYEDLLKLDQNCEEKIKNVFSRALLSFKENQEQFCKELAAGIAFDALRKTMDFIKEAAPLFVKMKDYCNSPSCPEMLSSFREAMRSFVSYGEMKSQLAEKILKWKESANQVFAHHPKTKGVNAADRDEFYKEVYASYKQLKQAKPLSEHVEKSIADVDVLEAKIAESIAKQLNQIAVAADKLVDAIPSTETSLYVDFNMWYDNLRSFKDHFEDPALQQIAIGKIKDINTRFDLKIRAMRDTAWHEADHERLVSQLVELKAIVINIPAYKQKIDQVLDGLLHDIKQKEGGAQKIGMLGLSLNKHPNQSIAQMIIAEHASFKGYALALRNEKTLRFKVEDVLDTKLDVKGVKKGLRGDDVNVGILAEHYKYFDEEYWKLVEAGLSSDRGVKDEMSRIVQNAKLIADKSSDYKVKVRDLMAHVFAHWTLANSKHFAEAATSSAKADKNYLMQPHAAQVISIFRLFGIDSTAATSKTTGGSGFFDKTKAKLQGLKDYVSGESFTDNNAIHLDNHLVQIGTGEGKSVTLAITSAVLGLFGYDVHCVCYSEYLSARDHDSFSSLFNAFGLSNHVSYGTFNKMCEDVINEDGDVRGLVEGLIKNNTNSLSASRSFAREKILLIDEVDVFFNKDFYGNLYRPLARLAHPTIAALINYVWSIRNNKNELTISKIKQAKEYTDCCNKFSEWTQLIEECVKAMLYDLRSFESQEYVVISDKIGYKDQDGISYSITYGYKTLFAYFKEHAAGNISQSSLDAQISLTIDCGGFSYAEMPRRYKCVMGVTGTLETLSKPELSLLRDVYNIRKFSYTPSVYGANQLQFSGDSASDVMIESDKGYFKAIRNEINTRLEGSIVKRAVLIFFESTPKLMAFYRSPEMQDIKERVKLITEEVSSVDKDGLIRQAVTSGSITLLTREFGRGTDFICYDDKLLASGGVHVVQTFVSDELSEETQIKGRTARQGNKGSFSMVLLDQTLERFEIRDADINEMKSSGKRYSVINQKRCDFFEKQYPENMRYVGEIKEDHAKAESFLSSLISGSNIAGIKAFLLDRNKANVGSFASSLPGGDKQSRTIVLMDATGSMSQLITKTKNTVKVMFERAYAVLQEASISANFELQFAVYRNYNASENELLLYSPWETNPDNLKTFIDSISAQYGMQDEAIEIGFWHVNQELEKGAVTQVILIGDAPAQSQMDVVAKRGRRGESYWAATKYSTPTFYQDELSLIKAKGIPVHAFYVDERARQNFEEIARVTEGGQCQALDIHSPAGAEMLTNLVTERILKNVGGEKMGDKLISAYRAKFCAGRVAAASSSIHAPGEINDSFDSRSTVSYRQG
jgi:hypothetical protein